MPLVCYNLLNSQNIPIKDTEKRLITRTPPTCLKKLQKLHRKRSSKWPMVSFIHIPVYSACVGIGNTLVVFKTNY